MSEADFGGGKQGSDNNGGSEGNKGKETAKEIDSGLISPTIRNPVQESDEHTPELEAQNELNTAGVQGSGEDGGRGGMNKGKEKAETGSGSKVKIRPDVKFILGVKVNDKVLYLPRNQTELLMNEKKYRDKLLKECRKCEDLERRRLLEEFFQSFNIHDYGNQEEKDDVEASNTPAAAVENKENGDEEEEVKIADQKEDNEESAADGN